MPDDAFGQMVRDFHRDAVVEPPQYHRDDGERTDAHLAGYFEPPSAWHPIERDLLTHVSGSVLDAGCGVGRHALVLQNRGHEVLAIDRSPGAVSVARERGVKNAVVGDIRLPPGDGFGTVVALGKQLGLGTSLADLRRTLDRLATVTRSGARLVADLDSTNRTDPGDSAAHVASEGVAYRTFRVEYAGLAGPWTDLLMVDPDRLRDAVAGTPWTVETLLGTGRNGSAYGVLLTLENTE